MESVTISTVAEPSAFTCPTVTLEFVTTSAPEKDELSPASVAVPPQPSMSSVPPPEIGAEIPVYYNPDNPESVSNSKNTGVISIAMIAAGVAAIALSILSGVKAFRKNRELDEQIRGVNEEIRRAYDEWNS